MIKFTTWDDIISKTIYAVKVSAVVTGVILASKSLYKYLFHNKDMVVENRVIDIRPYCKECKKFKIKHKMVCKHGNGTEALHEIFDSAKLSIDVCVYVFTDLSILNKLLDAKKRGVAIRIITDLEMAYANRSCIQPLHVAGVAIKWKKCVNSMHHKYCIVDSKIVLTGSFNWTEQAIKGNYENILILTNASGVSQFVTMFSRLWDTFEPFQPGESRIK